jgi:hypothetical protein
MRYTPMARTPRNKPTPRPEMTLEDAIQITLLGEDGQVDVTKATALRVFMVEMARLMKTTDDVLSMTNDK